MKEGRCHPPSIEGDIKSGVITVARESPEKSGRILFLPDCRDAEGCSPVMKDIRFARRCEGACHWRPQ